MQEDVNIEYNVSPDFSKFLQKIGASLLQGTQYLSDSEATQYAELTLFSAPDQDGLTCVTGFCSVTNSDQVNRYEILELVNFLVQEKIPLTSLLIRKSYIDDDGTKELADYIRESKTLRVLDVINAHISDLGIRYIMDALKTNTHLTHLNIRNNALTPALFNELIDLFTNHNFTIRQIGIVQRTSCPGEWKPTVEAEKQLHQLIVNNAKRFLEKEKVAARTAICRLVYGKPFRDELPTEVRKLLSHTALFANCPWLNCNRALRLLKDAEDDYMQKLKNS